MFPSNIITLDAGIPVICDQPKTVALPEAEELALPGPPDRHTFRVDPDLYGFCHGARGARDDCARHHREGAPFAGGVSAGPACRACRAERAGAGGRCPRRDVLFPSALAAACHDPVPKPVAQHLRMRGKPHKPVVVATPSGWSPSRPPFQEPVLHGDSTRLRKPSC